MDLKPTIGHIVHYQSHGSPNGQHLSEPRAAIVTGVHNATCIDLCVLNPAGLFFNTSVCFANPPAAGCWNWPPRS